MNARFKVLSTFTLKSRKLFVLSGKITRGRISDGMELQYTGTEGSFSALPIEEIGHSLHRDGSRSYELVCLCVAYSNEQELRAYKKLDFENRIFAVSQPAIRLTHNTSYKIKIVPRFVREAGTKYGSANELIHPVKAKSSPKKTSKLKTVSVKSRLTTVKRAAKKKK